MFEYMIDDISEGEKKLIFELQEFFPGESKIKKYWKHKNLDHVIYDYEPFDTSMFAVGWNIQVYRENVFLYFLYEIEKYRDNIIDLEKCLSAKGEKEDDS